jgi:hypothetical protein
MDKNAAIALMQAAGIAASDEFGADIDFKSDAARLVLDDILTTLINRGVAKVTNAKPGAPVALDNRNEKTRYEVKIEFSVDHYSAGMHEFVGTMDELKVSIKKAADKFYREVEDNFDKYGDHRCYCPMLGNGYPCRSPDMGDVVSFTVIDVFALIGGRKEEVKYHSDVYQKFRRIAQDEE